MPPKPNGLTLVKKPSVAWGAITTIADLREKARSRLPRAIFDYADRGSYDEITLRANRFDLAALRFRQRVMVDVSTRVLETSVLGERVALPVGIAPTGLTGLFHMDGEIHGARAAQAFGIPFCLSTMSICSIEDVRAAVDKPFWFQLYVMRDRAFSRSLIERAIAAKCSALVLTVDLQVQGQRHRDIKNGLRVPPQLTAANLFDFVTKPAWVLGVLRSKRRTFGNLAGQIEGVNNLDTLSRWISDQFDPSLSWKDIEWVRALWPNKLIVKGIMDADDARNAVAAGADAIVVSNHGGRQLDGAPSSISVLPEIVCAVSERAEIIFDGGVQSGQDVLKALALGARACLIGKSFLYALAAGGGQGVLVALEILSRELSTSMALVGATDVRKVTSSILRAR